MLLYPTEMYVQFVKMLQQGSKWCTLGHLGKGIDILGEALAAITELTIGAWYVGMGVVDIARKQNTCMYLAPVCTHLLAILAAGIEIGDLIGSKDIVHILGQLCLQRSHYGEFLTHENLGKQFVCSSENHRLLAEVLKMGTLGEELWHIAYLMAGLLG